MTAANDVAALKIESNLFFNVDTRMLDRDVGRTVLCVERDPRLGATITVHDNGQGIQAF